MTNVIAHRGLRSEQPENTLGAFNAALKLPGLHGIEMDVEITHDNAPIVLHQETLVPNLTFSRVEPAERNYTSRDWVAEHSAQEILKLDAGSWFGSDFSSQQIPSLSDVMALDWRDVVAYVELKDATYWGTRDPNQPLKVVNAALPVLRAFSDNLNVISFNPEILVEVGARAPHISRTLNLWTEWKARQLEAVNQAKRCGASGINLPDVMVLESPDWVKTMHDNGLGILVYPVSPARGEAEFLDWTAASQEQKWRKLNRLGVDGLMTDFARETLEFFEEI